MERNEIPAFQGRQRIFPILLKHIQITKQTIEIGLEGHLVFGIPGGQPGADVPDHDLGIHR